MSWDSVPWAVGGGALHSPEVARLLAYAATSGSEGVVGIGDCTVRALAVPGASVRVSPGATVIRNRGTGGAQQNYIARLATEDVVGIASTGSSAGRSDMVIARVEDPYAAGTPWQDPADPTVGPYVFTRVLSNVPASAIASPTAARKYLAGTGYSAIPLAGVTLPASTGTVTQAMVKSLREMANPRRQRIIFTRNLSAQETQTFTGDTGEVWPNVSTWTVDVPDWAARVKVVAQWGQVKVPPGNVQGNLWARIASVDTQRVAYDTPGSTQTARSSFIAADDIVVPAAVRGTLQNVYMMARLGNGPDASRLVLDNGSAIVLDMEFLEAAAEDAV